MRRQLWKRAYEVNAYGSEDFSSQVAAIKAFLNEKGARFEHICANVAISRLRHREFGSRSENTLRLVKKDEHFFPRIFPIEDYSRGISDEYDVRMDRVYLEPKSLNMFKDFLLKSFTET